MGFFDIFKRSDQIEKCVKRNVPFPTRDDGGPDRRCSKIWGQTKDQRDWHDRQRDKK